MKRILALFVVSLIPTLSCGGTSEAPVEAEAPGEAEAPATAPVAEEREPSLPEGMFRDVGELCARQMKEVVPLLENARREMSERYGSDDGKIVPACAESPAAMRNVRVSLGGPYLEVKAVSYETGWATRTSVIVRTTEGWTNVGIPIETNSHDDPGCPSIVRDAGLTEIRIDRGHIVLVDEADRGFGEDSRLIYERARTCTLGTCTEPVTIGARVVPSDGNGPAKHLFETTFTVDELGAIVPASAWDGEAE